MSARQIVIIGAGLSGLSAAYRLQQAGHQVRALEAESHVGGRVITIHWQGYAIDPGAEFMSGAERYLLDMVHQLGIDDKLINYSEQQVGFEVGVMWGGRVYTCQLHVPIAVPDLEGRFAESAPEHDFGLWTTSISSTYVEQRDAP